MRKGLGELSMNLLLPCLMFSQVIYCNSETYKSRQAACPNMAQVILASADLFLWPIVVVTSGYVLGFLAAKLMRVPENFRRAAAGSVAFGNSTGMPVTLLTTLGPSLVQQGVLQGDPLLYLPVYLVLSPLLQWTVGSYIFRSCEKAVEEDVETATPPEPEPEQPNFPRAATLSLPYVVERPEIRFGTLRVPLEVGSGFSAQAEIEDVLKPQDVELKKRDRCSATLRHILFLFLSPPVAATLLGILVAFIRPVQNQFLDLNDRSLTEARTLDWIYKAIRTLGQAAVPVNLLMLGSNLSKGADFGALPLATGIVLALTKMLVQPAAVAGLVFLASRLVPDPDINSKWLVAIIVSLTPTANNIMVQVEVGGQDKAAMSTLIFIQYLLSPVLLTITLTATSVLMQLDGFLPSHHHLDLYASFGF